MKKKILSENFSGIRNLYDNVMAANTTIHDLVYPRVFGNDQYIGQFSDNSANELKLMGQLMNLPETSHVLDVGCGRGHVAAFMKKTFDWSMTGIDISSVPIQYAIEKYSKDTKLNFIHKNIYHYVPEHVFNGIYATGAICHFDVTKLMQCITSLLSQYGIFAFMERVRLGKIPRDDWQKLTTEWCCPYVYSVHEYKSLFAQQGYVIKHMLDLSENFCRWQERSITVREELKDKIIHLSSRDYYRASIDFAEYENKVTKAGRLGYVCMVMQRGNL